MNILDTFTGRLSQCLLYMSICTGGGVFGVPLVTLVTSEGNDVPKIIRRVVEHVDKYGNVPNGTATLRNTLLHFTIPTISYKLNLSETHAIPLLQAETAVNTGSPPSTS